MQQQETFAARGRAVAAVEPRDAEHGDVEQRFVGRLVNSVSASDPVREQREMQLVVGGGEVVDLEPVQVFLDRRARAQHHRHRHQRAQFLGHALAQREARQAARADAARHRAVDQRHGDVDRRHRAEHA